MLFNAPVTSRNLHARLSPPLGLAYIAGGLVEAGYRVSALDFNVSGLELRRVDMVMAHDKPAVIGISAMTETYGNALRIATRAKELNPDTVVVLGGAHPTILPREVMASVNVDYVVVGPGERSMVALVNVLLRSEGDLDQVPGLAYARRGQVVMNRPDVLRAPEDMPEPQRGIFPIELYEDKWNVLTATGSCPYRCPFCSAASLWQGRRRMRDPAHIVAEIRDLTATYGVSDVFFTDDIFTLNRRWVRELMDELGTLEHPVRWGCATRVDSVDRELLTLMADSGCSGIQFGVESGSQEVLDSVKGIEKEQVIDAVTISLELGIEPVCSFIMPFPEDTEQTLRETKLFIKELHSLGSGIFLSYMCPFPGTLYYEQAEELGVHILGRSWDEFDAKHVVMETRHLGAKRITEIMEDIASEVGMRRSVPLHHVAAEDATDRSLCVRTMVRQDAERAELAAAPIELISSSRVRQAPEL
ncbi:MAG: B12-binding domain-containing radical SAM protein [Actinomycetia bacterium]|nr:B12-binding domain-containing radical SAM protein [Actinomycetes bacterium]